MRKAPKATWFGPPPGKLNAPQAAAWLELAPHLEQLDRATFTALVYLKAATAPPVWPGQGRAPVVRAAEDLFRLLGVEERPRR